MVEALGALPPDVTVVLVAREQPPKLRAPKKLAEAVEAAGGEVLAYDAPEGARAARLARRRGPAARLRARARRRAAARRAARGLDRAARDRARPAGALGRRGRPVGRDGPRGDGRRHLRGGRLGALGRDRRPRPGGRARGGRAARRAGRGGDPARLPGGEAPARGARGARAAGGGAPPKEVEAALPMHPYAAKMLVRAASRVARASELRAATCAIADLEWWTRGGADYPERVALTLAVAAPRARWQPSSGGGAGAEPGGARLLAGAGVAVQRALLDRLVDPRDEPRCSASAASASPASTAASSRRKWVLTALVRRRFSSCSRRSGRCASSVRRCWPSGDGVTIAGSR